MDLSNIYLKHGRYFFVITYIKIKYLLFIILQFLYQFHRQEANLSVDREPCQSYTYHITIIKGVLIWLIESQTAA